MEEFDRSLTQLTREESNNNFINDKGTIECILPLSSEKNHYDHDYALHQDGNGASRLISGGGSIEKTKTVKKRYASGLVDNVWFNSLEDTFANSNSEHIQSDGYLDLSSRPESDEEFSISYDADISSNLNESNVLTTVKVAPFQLQRHYSRSVENIVLNPSSNHYYRQVQTGESVDSPVDETVPRTSGERITSKNSQHAHNDGLAYEPNDVLLNANNYSLTKVDLERLEALKASTAAKEGKENFLTTDTRCESDEKSKQLNSTACSDENDHRKGNLSDTEQVSVNVHSVTDEGHLSSENYVSYERVNMLHESESDGLPEVTYIDAKTGEVTYASKRKAKGRPKKGGMSRKEIKIARNTNRAYRLPTGIMRGGKTVNLGFKCDCKKNCYNQVDDDVKTTFFDDFHSSGDYKARSIFIMKNCERLPTARHTNTKKPQRKRLHTFTYKIHDIPVCKKFFFGLLQISHKAVPCVFDKIDKNVPVEDYRGLKGGGNLKLTDSEENDVISFINSLKRYVSHYERAKSGQSEYLEPGITIDDTYYEYRSAQIAGKKKHVSKSSYKKIMRTYFNIHPKVLKKDSCDKCDKLLLQMTQEKNHVRALSLGCLRTQHLDDAATVRNQRLEDIQRARYDPNFETFDMDFQKVLNIPKLTTGPCYYLRLLNIANFCIQPSSGPGMIFSFIL